MSKWTESSRPEGDTDGSGSEEDMSVEVISPPRHTSPCHERNSNRSPNMLVGPGVESRVQLAAIDCRSVACVLEERKCEVTREGPTGLRVSTKSGVSGVFLEWFREVRSSGELQSY